MKVLTYISRVLVGLLFIFSGFVKAVDPLGTVYKNGDYFTDAFHLPGLTFLSFPLAIIMIAAEFTVGLMLIVNVLPKLASWGALLLMLFFTPLTLYLAIANPVSDCGCFGDAIKLTNWETFYKNVIILLLVIFVFVMRNKFELKMTKKNQWIILLGFIALTVGFQYYNLNNLPIIDFRPYKVGTNIQESMTIPEGMPVDVYETVLVYKNLKTNELKEFTTENFPWEDTLTWAWVSTDAKLISEGFKPPIHDFSITALDGFDITEDILNEETPVLLFVAYNLGKTKIKGFEKVKEIWNYCESKEFYFYGLTASLEDDINKVKSEIGYEMDFCNTDEIQLKTIVRSNPGLVLLKKGTVMGVWHWRHLPSIEEIEKLIK